MPPSVADAPILATKLFVPPPRERLVPRARLRDRLAAVRGGRVTLIAAAAGSGKSTLLADWALEATGRVAWLSLDGGDDEPRRFLNYVVAALRQAQGIAADDLLDLRSSRTEAVEATTTELLNAIAVRGAPVALVLDDYHIIEDRAVHDVVQFVVDHLPPNLHLVIATRADPPLALSRLRARGLLLELRGSDLRFTADEAGAFLNDAMGLALTASDVEELERRTEGWAVGLQMAAISLSGREGAHGFIQRFSGSNRYVLDYLTDEVLDRQPQETRRFLLATSILTRLTPGLCDAVLERTDSAGILEQLDDDNLFLIPLDDVRYWYRYHHLFATLLRHQLTRAAGAAEIAELHQRAAAWYAANRMPEPALEHALAAGDVDGAVRIVATHAAERMLCGDTASVVRWFELLPKARIENDVELLLALGMSLLGDWQLPRALDCTIRATALLHEDSPPQRRGAVLALRGALERALGMNDAGLARLEEAAPLVAPESFAFCLVHYFRGLTSVMEADARAAEHAFTVVRALRSRVEELITAVLAQTITAIAAWWRGEPDVALALAEETFGWIDMTEKVAEGRPLDCLPYAVQAHVRWSWNELETARGLAERALEHGRRSVMIGLYEGCRSRARVAMSSGEWETAARAATEAQRAVRNIGSNELWTQDIGGFVHSVVFRRWQALGNAADLATVETWLRTSNVMDKQREWTARRGAGFACDTSLLIGARVLIEREAYGQAEDILELLWPDADRTARLLARIEILIVRAILEGRRGRVDDAVTAMQSALELAAPPRYLRPFLDEGAAVQPLIERAAGSLSDRNFATRLLSSFDTPVKLPARTAAPEDLSDRELEVLRLIASGASNQEAARKLFIAPSTVKKHLENIYAKLEVGGRVEAIGRARERNLL